MPQEQDIGGWVEVDAGVEFDIDGVVERAAIVTPTPYWSYGQSVMFTDNDVTDDTEQFSYGESHSILESTYTPVVITGGPQKGLLLNVYRNV
jgi:hypothetical protein